MSESKKELKFKWSRFGCYEQAIRDFAEAMGYTLVGLDPEGVYVVPGMRITYTCRGQVREYTVAPNGTNSGQRLHPEGLSYWDEDGFVHWSMPDAILRYIKYKSKKVLGYQK